MVARNWFVVALILEIVVTLLVGGAFAGVLVLALRPSYLAESWSETECVILDSQVVEIEDPDNNYFEAQVSWQYVVDGETYRILRGDPQTFGVAYAEPDARAVAERYRAGETVRCYYDPKRPITSALDRNGPPWRTIAVIAAVALGVLAVVGAVVGGVGVVLFLRRRRNTAG